MLLYRNRKCAGEHVVATAVLISFCSGELTWGSSGDAVKPPGRGSGSPLSMRVVGAGDADLYEDCSGKKYASSVLPMDGCTELFNWPPTNSIRLVAGSLATPQLPQARHRLELVRGTLGAWLGWLQRGNIRQRCRRTAPLTARSRMARALDRPPGWVGA